MVEHLAHDLGSLRHGAHLCLPYDDVDERNQAVIPFIAEGLARGERCVYLIDTDQRESLLGALSGAGVNASRALDRGALWLRTPEETYFRSGKFDPDDTLALADELIAGALGDGFSGVRGSGEIASSEQHGVAWEQIFAYEVRFNERFARRPFVAMCRYHRAVSPASTIAGALRTHPTAIVSGRLCHNSYYERPEVALAGDAERVEWMLRQLRRSSASDLRALAMTRSLARETSRLSAENQTRAHTEEELERALRLRDRFLAELTHELAAPVAGLSAEIEALAGATPGDRQGQGHDDRTASAALVKHLKRLGAVVEQLKEVSRITNRQGVLPPEDVDLVEVARQVVLRNRDRLAALGPGATLRTEAGIENIHGRWDRRRLEQLITNLVLSAAQLGAGRPVDLELASDAGLALISVRYRGTAEASDDDANLLDRAARPAQPQTPTDGGRVGLWVAREIASAFGGTLRLPGCGGDGTAVVTVELPRSGPRSRLQPPRSRPSRS